MGIGSIRWTRRPGRESGTAALVLAGLLAAQPAAAQLRGSFAEEATRAPPKTPSAESAALPSYRVKPVDGAPASSGIRRVIETFAGWTLICDEEKRRRICNASQSIVGADGRLAFSWSLAATKGGEPVFIVRAPVMGFPAHTVTLDFGTDETVIRLPACDAQLCLGFLPLTPEIVKRIKGRASVGIRYRPQEGAAPVAITASLDGLDTAIGSIR